MNELYHHGVKGQKWGVRRTPEELGKINGGTPKVYKLHNYKGKAYFLSDKNLDGKTINPRIPKNFLTENGYEDNTTPRICFSHNPAKCLTAMSSNVKDRSFNVYVPSEKHDIYKPNKYVVPDADITDELWIKEPVKLKKVGTIKCTGDTGEAGLEYIYGGKHKAELYDWNYEWTSMEKDDVRHSELYHHGVKGQKWGVKNGPPYPVTRVTNKSTAKDANDIYNTFSLDDKRKVTARKDPPKEFTNDEEYTSNVHMKSFMTKYKDTPVSVFDVWSEGDGGVALSLMTRSGDEYRGKGYASMAVKKGIEWIDNNPEIMTAYWDVRKDNKASIALAKKSGFRKMRGEGRDPEWTAYQKKYKR